MLYRWVENNFIFDGKESQVQSGFVGKNEVKPYSYEGAFGWVSGI